MSDFLIYVVRLFTRPYARLSLLALTVLALQTTVFADTSFAGVHGQVMVLLAACCGAQMGVERGVIAGFVIGFMYDLVLTTPFGVASMVLAIVAATAGLSGTFFMAPPWWAKCLAVAIASVVGEVAFPLLLNVVGVEGWMDARVIKVSFVVGSLNLLLSPVGLALVRWAMKLAPPRTLKRSASIA